MVNLKARELELQEIKNLVVRERVTRSNVKSVPTELVV
jgi:hypothetical protein